MNDPLLQRLFAYVEEAHPRSLKGIEEARELDPARFDACAQQMLAWLVEARGADALERGVDSFVRFSTDVNLHQARYEVTGAYENKRFADLVDEHYSDVDVMSDYLLGVYLTNFLWSHHFEITTWFEDRFLDRWVQDAAEIIEIAPGHGGWGVTALARRANATLRGFDISPASIQIARSIADASGAGDRARYEERDALDLGSLEAASADNVICSFLIEHLEDPGKLMAVIEHLLRPGGRAYLTGALTAAQVDHIYEFDRESELVQLAEAHGLRVRETLSVHPARQLPKAKFLPRSMALLLEKRATGRAGG